MHSHAATDPYSFEVSIYLLFFTQTNKMRGYDEFMALDDEPDI